MKNILNRTPNQRTLKGSLIVLSLLQVDLTMGQAMAASRSGFTSWDLTKPQILQ